MKTAKTSKRQETRGTYLEVEIIGEIESLIGTPGLLNWSGYLRQLVLQDLARLRARDGKAKS
jgi:hypothetical protein